MGRIIGCNSTIIDFLLDFRCLFITVVTIAIIKIVINLGVLKFLLNPISALNIQITCIYRLNIIIHIGSNLTGIRINGCITIVINIGIQIDIGVGIAVNIRVTIILIDLTWLFNI